MKDFTLFLLTAVLLIGTNICDAKESQKNQNSSTRSSEWDKLDPDTQKRISDMEDRW